jgi:hypothetical protein
VGSEEQEDWQGCQQEHICCAARCWILRSQVLDRVWGGREDSQDTLGGGSKQSYVRGLKEC